jgi:hypothetical protein
VLQYRLETYDRVARSADERAKEVARCSKSFLYMANVYGSIFEARDREMDWEENPLTPEDALGLPATEGEAALHKLYIEDDTTYESATGQGGVIPYIMYPFQVELSQWIDDRMRRPGNLGDGAIIKARDMGVSNLACFWGAHKWMFRSPFQLRILSRKEELVDQKGNPDSLFWKIDTFLMSLPAWLFMGAVPGFNWRRDRMDMRLINPSNQNLIAGESTNANAGRGGRATAVFCDEAAFMPNFRAIWTAIRASTRHRLIITTPSVDQGLDCYNVVHGEAGYTAPPTYKIPWDAHPLHDITWFHEEQKRDDPQKFAQEVLMDWFAGSGEWIYPEAREITEQNGRIGYFPYEPGMGPFAITIDDGYDDDWAMAFLQYNERTGRWRLLDGYAKSHLPPDYYGSLLKSIYLGDFVYDAEAKRVMHWLKIMPPAIYFGDAHGAQIEQVSQTSVYAHLSDRWGIDVNYYIGANEGTRLPFSKRRLELGAILQVLDVNDTPGARSVLQAIKNHRFKTQENDGNSVTEQRTPIHSKWSHFVSAMEYLAVQREMLDFASKMSRGDMTYSAPRAGRSDRGQLPSTPEPGPSSGVHGRIAIRREPGSTRNESYGAAGTHGYVVGVSG